MNYGQALESAKQGRQILREGWNGRGMYIFLFSRSQFCIKEGEGLPITATYDYPLDDENENPMHHIGFDTNDEFIPLSDFLILKSVQNTCVPWVPSQSDQLADDWEVVITR